MSKKPILLVALIAVVLSFGLAIKFYYQNLRGAGPAFLPPKEDITKDTVPTTTKSGEVKQSVVGLKIPNGFSVSIFAKNLPDARVIVADKDGNIWLSQTGQGKISKLTVKDNKLVKQETVLSKLQNPHGLAFDPKDANVLYIAEETKISKTTVTANGVGPLEKVVDLPKKGFHFTRTLGFGSDDRLYVSIGSSCNVCVESDPHYASLWSLNKDGSDFKEVARGLRNSVFFTWNPSDGKMWATEMGRDLLDDNLPPDEINIIDTKTADILNFGWPNCYGKNIHDTAFDKNIYIRNPCMEPLEKESHIDVPAHSAPLGLAFVSANSSWPSEYKNDLFVAYHGSWNRSVPTGYKVVRYHLDNSGNVLSTEDFITGWLKDNKASGRPVDIIFGQDGKMYVSDDKAGVIYQVEYSK